MSGRSSKYQVNITPNAVANIKEISDVAGDGADGFGIERANGSLVANFD